MLSQKAKSRWLIALLVVAIVAASIALVFTVTPSSGNKASAAVAADSNFPQLANGTQYTISNKTGYETVTVNTSSANGTKTNPFVINTTARWNTFASKITNNDTAYNGKYFVLGADLNFGGASVAPAGASTTGWTGILCGRGYKITNAKFSCVSANGYYCAGLFANVCGGQVIDVCVSTGCTLPSSDNSPYAGGLIAGKSTGGYFINDSVTCDQDFTVVALSRKAAAMGGICGWVKGNIYIYKCQVNANFTMRDKVSAAQVNDGNKMGGCIGAIYEATNFYIDRCYIKVKLNWVGGGPNGAGFLGSTTPSTDASQQAADKYVIKASMTNTIVDFDRTTSNKATDVSILSPDVNYVVCGWPYWNNSSDTVDTGNLYVVSNQNLNNGTLTSSEGNVTGTLASRNTVYKQASTGTVKNYFNFTTDSSGNVTGLTTKDAPGQDYTITYNLNGTGTSWSASGGTASTTYRQNTTSTQGVTKLATTPTRTGYDFRGWATSVSGTGLFQTSASGSCIAKGQTGNITYYAIWSITKATASAPAVTKTYESTNVGVIITLKQDGVSAATQTVNAAYTWQYSANNSSWTNVTFTNNTEHDITNNNSKNVAKITFELPTVAQKGYYKVNWVLSRATSGETVYQDTDDRTKGSATVQLTVNPYEVDIPTTNTLTYKPTDTNNQTGVNVSSATSSRATISGTTAARLAGSYTATAALKDKNNYIWKGSTNADRTITWSIAKYTVAVPTLTDDNHIYKDTGVTPFTGVEQTAHINVPTASSPYVAVSGTSNKGTTVGTYTANYNLTDTSNLKWSTAPAAGESATYPITWHISKQPVAIPTMSVTSVVYKETEYTMAYTVDGRGALVGTTNCGTNAGTYTAQFKLNDTANYKWATSPAGGESANYPITWTITKKPVALPVISNENLVYNEASQTKVSVHSTAVNSVGDDLYTITDGAAVDASLADTPYVAVASLVDKVNYKWIATSAVGMVFDSSNVESGNISISWHIAKQVVAMPTLVTTTAVYNEDPITMDVSPDVHKAVVLVVGTNVKTDVGTYKAQFNLSSTRNYKWEVAPAAGESSMYEVSWQITKKPVTLPVIDSAQFVYSTQPQTKVSVASGAQNKNGEDLYTITNGTGTVVNNYTASVALVDPHNYMWLTGEGIDTTGMVFSSTDAKSGAITIAWTIIKANVTLSAPLQQSGITMHVGRQLNVYKFDTDTAAVAGDNSILNAFANGDARNASYNGVTVEGTWAWKTPGYQLQKGDSTATVVFTPTDGANYIGGEKEATINVHQLTVTVFAYDKPNNVLYGTHTYDITYGGRFVFLTDIKHDINADFNSGYTDSYWTDSYFSIEYVDNNNIPLTSIENIISDKEVHIKRTAGVTPYRIYYIRQQLSGALVPKEQIISIEASNGNLSNFLVEVVNGTAATDSFVTAPLKSGGLYAGFTQKASIVYAGKSYISSFRNIKVEADPSGEVVTRLYVYYQRNTYSLGLNANRGTLAEGNVNSTRIMFGASYTVNEPSREGYDFVGWYDNSAMEGDPVGSTFTATMGSSAITYYAKWTPRDYYISYRTDNADFEDPQHYVKGDEFVIGTIVESYTVESFSGGRTIQLHSPTAVGYRFIGWSFEEYSSDGTTPFTKLSKEALDAHLRSLGFLDEKGNVYYPEDYEIELFAFWTPDEYTVRFDPNGGDPVSPTSKNVVNLSLYGSLPTPNRPGYDFEGWYYAGEHDPVTANRQVSLYEDKIVTLYANWTPKAFQINYTYSVPTGHEGKFTPVLYITRFNTDLEEWQEVDYLSNVKVHYGEQLRFSTVMAAGYELVGFRIAGVLRSIDDNYPVAPDYSGNTINIAVEVGLATLDIEYNYSGYTVVDRNAFRTQFTLDDKFQLPDGRHMVKPGYTFVSWEYTDSNGNTASITAINTGVENQVRRSITLRAAWKAAPQIVETYRNISTDPDKDMIQRWQNANTETDKLFPIPNPWLNKNFVFVGWATSPSGAVEFQPGAGDEYDSEGNRTKAGAIEYKVKAGENKLYARWQLQGVDFVELSANRNNIVYSPTDTDGITMTAKPNHQYEPDKLDDGREMIFVYTWYKLPSHYEDNAYWSYMGEENHGGNTWKQYVYVDSKDSVNNGHWNKFVRTIEVVEAEFSGSIDVVEYAWDSSIGEVYTNTVTATNQQVNYNNSYTIKDCASAGGYLTVVRVTGGVQGTDETTAQGVFNAVINKAEYTAIGIRPGDSVYDPDRTHGLVVAEEGITWNNTHTQILLPDLYNETQSSVSVSYRYFKGDSVSESDEITQNKIRDVGIYTVLASFTFVNDKGNYNTPQSVSALLTITPKPINSVSYTMEKYNAETGNWDRKTGYTDIYNGNGYRIVATSTDIHTSDAQYVSFTYIENQGSYASQATNVGSYEARVSNVVKGADRADGFDVSSNYKMGTHATSQVWHITKATHDMSAYEFVGNTVVYDGEVHLLALAWKDHSNTAPVTLPAGVSISYSVKYTERHTGYVSSQGQQQGGVDAGDYVITVNFSDSNIANYNAIAPLTATLKIERATITLTDAQKGELASGRNISYDPNSRGFKPELASDFALVEIPDSSRYHIEYTYEELLADGVTYVDVEFDPLYDGYRVAGTYRNTAIITYLDNELRNNYNAIADTEAIWVISSGDIDRINIIHKDSVTYKYGMSLDYSALTVEVVYIIDDYGTTSAERVNAAACNYYEYTGDSVNPKGDKFTHFNRVTNSYPVVLECFSKTEKFYVKVEKETLNVSDVAFADGVSKSYQYTGVGYSPVLSEDNSYGVVGVVADEELHFTPTYTYAPLDSSKNPTAPFGAMPADGLLNVGSYRVKATLACAENDKYNDITNEWTFDVTINPLDVVSSSVEVLFQYEETAEHWTTLAIGEELTYRSTPYNFRFVMKGVGVDSDEDIAITTTYKGSAPSVTNQGEYTIDCVSADSNYKLNASRTVKINPYQVDIIWAWVEGSTLEYLDQANIVYNGAEQLANVKVYYKEIGAGDTDYTEIAGVALEAGVSAFMNATTYTLTIGEPADSNYIVKNASDKSTTVTINPYVIDNAHGDIAWYYVENGNDKAIEVKDGVLVLPYKGAAYQIKLKFVGVGPIDSAKTFPVLALTDDASAVKDARASGLAIESYTLVADMTSAAAHTNYQFATGENAVSATLVVTQKEVVIDWSSYTGAITYTGKEIVLTPVAMGIGEDGGKNLLDKISATEVNQYTASPEILAEFANNYVIASESTSFDWEIVPYVLPYTWTTEGATIKDGDIIYTYNASEQAPVATDHPRTNAEDEPDNTGSVPTIYKLVGENDWQVVSESITAGTYKKVMSINNKNYALDETSNNVIVYVVAKAVYQPEDVKYIERDQYGVNVSYVLNPQGLLEDAIVWNKAAEEYVPGTISFVNASNALASVGTVNVSYVFIPDDRVNYDPYTGTLEITVKKQTAIRLDIAFGVGTITQYYLGNTFDTYGYEAYRVYDSYYEKNGQEYGQRVKLSVAEYTALTKRIIDGKGQTHNFTNNYLITEDDAAAESLKVWFSEAENNISGEITVTVLKAAVQTLSITNPGVIGSDFYEGDAIDISGINLKLYYVDGTSADMTLGRVNTATITCSDSTAIRNGLVFTFPNGDKELKTISITYGQATAELKFEVKPKEELNIKFSNSSISYKAGEPLSLPVPVVDNGDNTTSALPGGIEVSYVKIVGENREPVTYLTDLGTYTIEVSFTFDLVKHPELRKYKQPAPIVATVEVSEIVHLLNATEPELTAVYSGEVIPSEVLYSNITNEDGSALSYTTVSEIYSIVCDGVGPVKQIVNAGTYYVTYTINYSVDSSTLSLSKAYTIVVEKAQATLSVELGDWIVGSEPAEPTITNNYGEVVLAYAPVDTEAYVAYSHDTALSIQPGSYVLRATIYDDAQGNFIGTEATTTFAVGIAEIAGPETEEGEVIVDIRVPEGSTAIIDPKAELVVIELDIVEAETVSIKRQESLQGYEVDIVKDGQKVEFNGELEVSLLISAEYRDRDDLKVFYIDEDGNAVDMNAWRSEDGTQMVFKTTHFSRYIITAPAKSNGGLIAGVVIGGVIAVGLVVAVVVVFLKKRKER